MSPVVVAKAGAAVMKAVAGTGTAAASAPAAVRRMVWGWGCSVGS